MSLPNYQRYQLEFEELQAKVGAAVAKSASFNDIMQAFVREAAPRNMTSDGPAQDPSSLEGGLPGRVLRTLRRSGDSDG